MLFISLINFFFVLPRVNFQFDGNLFLSQKNPVQRKKLQNYNLYLKTVFISEIQRKGLDVSFFPIIVVSNRTVNITFADISPHPWHTRKNLFLWEIFQSLDSQLLPPSHLISWVFNRWGWFQRLRLSTVMLKRDQFDLIHKIGSFNLVFLD